MDIISGSSQSVTVALVTLTTKSELRTQLPFQTLKQCLWVATFPLLYHATAMQPHQRRCRAGSGLEEEVGNGAVTSGGLRSPTAKWIYLALARRSVAWAEAWTDNTCGWRRDAGKRIIEKFRGSTCNTLIIFYKRRPIRDGRQIVEKNKRQGLAFSKMLRDSAHWNPEEVGCRIWAKGNLEGRIYIVKYAQ